MAHVDPAFAYVVPEMPTFLVWRLDGNELRPVPAAEHGTFYREDAYLVYSAAEQTVFGGGRAVRGPLAAYIHFLIGPQANANAATVVERKADELDRLLGGHAVQHKEANGYISARFQSYFRSGVRFLDGSASRACGRLPEQFG